MPIKPYLAIYARKYYAQETYVESYNEENGTFLFFGSFKILLKFYLISER